MLGRVMRVVALGLAAGVVLAPADPAGGPVSGGPVSGGPVSGRAVPRALPTGGGTPAAVVYSAPLGGALSVLRPFAPPTTPYGPGHLGVDLAAPPDAGVRAAGPGTVRFAGQVAGRGVVVIVHPDGVTTEYEPVRPSVRAGSPVARGGRIGVVSGRHLGCARSCLHWGARSGGAYLDPFSLLRPLGAVVLLPEPVPG
jgi:murein DD-endopeptidase MepM/ murein hydrolase activator NlpD